MFARVQEVFEHHSQAQGKGFGVVLCRANFDPCGSISTQITLPFYLEGTDSGIQTPRGKNVKACSVFPQTKTMAHNPTEAQLRLALLRPSG